MNYFALSCIPCPDSGVAQAVLLVVALLAGGAMGYLIAHRRFKTALFILVSLAFVLLAVYLINENTNMFSTGHKAGRYGWDTCECNIESLSSQLARIGYGIKMLAVAVPAAAAGVFSTVKLFDKYKKS